MTPLLTIKPRPLAALKSAASSKFHTWSGDVPLNWAEGVIKGLGTRHELPEHTLSRTDIRKLWRNPKNSTEKCFLCTMAWGGMHSRNARFAWNARKKWLPTCESVRMGRRTRKEAFHAFHQLRLSKRMPGLGCAYFTKILFFGRPTEDAYILDHQPVRVADCAFYNASGHSSPWSRVMVSNSTRDRSVVIISVMSVVIALAAAISTCIQAWDGHRQNEIANDASLGFDIDTDDRLNRLGMRLRNVGPGKVQINAVTYYVDNKAVSGVEEAIEAAKLDVARLLLIDLKDDWMGPGEAIPIFRYRAQDSDLDRAATFIEQHLEVAVKYCTVGGRCETKCSERGHCGAVRD